MLVDLYYIFIPTPTLIEAARSAGVEWIEPEVCIDSEQCRLKQEFSPNDIESLYWSLFLAKLECSCSESEPLNIFRQQCIALGLQGCWDMHAIKGHWTAADLIDEVKSLSSLANKSSPDA